MKRTIVIIFVIQLLLTVRCTNPGSRETSDIQKNANRRIEIIDTMTKNKLVLYEGNDIILNKDSVRTIVKVRSEDHIRLITAFTNPLIILFAGPKPYTGKPRNISSSELPDSDFSFSVDHSGKIIFFGSDKIIFDSYLLPE